MVVGPGRIVCRRPIRENDLSRRGFLQATSIGGLALLSAAVGRALFSSNRAAASQQSEVIINPGTSDIPVAAAFDDIEGITPAGGPQ